MSTIMSGIGMAVTGVTQAQAADAGTTELFPLWVQVIMLGIVALVVLWIIKNLFSDFFTALFSKKKTVQATLTAKVAEGYVNKRMFVSQNPAGGVDSGVAEKGVEYRFDFELEGGGHVILEVPKNAYDVAVENTTGELTYKGKQFISYKARTEGTVMVDDTIENNFVPINKKF